MFKNYLSNAIQEKMQRFGVRKIEDLALASHIIIKAPTGAGKNHFCLHTLPKMAGGKPILFITSRKATVEQFERQLKEKADSEGFSPSVIFGRIGEARDGRNFIYGHSWDIENNLAEYIELARKGFFKYIVMDECHSLTTDALFASAPSAVYELLEAAAPQSIVILMSACPDIVFENEIATDYISLDFSYCHKAEPQNVEIIKGNTASALLRKASENNKILYFVSSTKEAYRLEKKYNEKGIRTVAITSKQQNREKVYTSEEKINGYKSESGLLLKYLREHERFPDNIDLIICTSKLREGINIKDKRVKTVITDLRDSVSLIQCSGRIRHGVENFYILDKDTVQWKGDYTKYYENSILQRANYNLTLHGYQDQELKKKYIDYIEKESMGALYYSPAQDSFIINRFYLSEYERQQSDHDEWLADRVEYVKRVMERERVIYTVEDDKLIKIIEPYCNLLLTVKEKNAILEELNSALPLDKRVSKKINNILKLIGFYCEMQNDRRHYIIRKN